jgi:spoIIIJ-associated protein
MDQQSQELEKIIKDLFTHLDFKADFQIKPDGEVLVVNLKTQEPGVLIGYHGQTLAALQQIITLMAFKKFNQWIKILVDVEDYREKRKESLEQMAQGVVERVKSSGQSQPLPPMSSFERRIIHMFLAGQPEVESVSEGEGEQRHIIIKAKA